MIAALALLGAATPAVEATPVPPGFASANVEWLANVPLHADSSGARLRMPYLYVTSSHELTIYDVSRPETPVPVSTLPIPQTPYAAEEDVDTNGKVLLIGTVGRLLVIDARDPKLPKITGMLDGGDEHTVTCVLDCTWAYGSGGGIYDLRDPAAPKEAGDWSDGRGVKSFHDVTEVSPGMVLTSSQPILLLDARRNPARPAVAATGRSADGRFVHANLWPNGGTDRMLLVGGETSGGNCSDPDAGAFMTWDASRWQTTRRFTMLAEYRPPDVLPNEGGFPVATFCSHWFTTRPGYRNGGIVAVGWYERGTRFLRVARDGKISEVGWFLPAGTSVSAAYWVNKDLLYLIDYNRGLDVVKFHDKPVRSAGRPASRDRGLPPTRAPLFPVTLRPSYGTVCPVPVR
jgi:hypothetical protein